MDTVEQLCNRAEIRDPRVSHHSERVADLAEAIAREMGMMPERIEEIHIAGLLHDLGKIAIPEEIFSKPRRLNERELALIRSHPGRGYEMLKIVSLLRPAAEMIYQHHERLDGSGYPRGLKDKDILRGAKIIAVADVVDALASHGRHRPALGIDAALKEISRNRGNLYNANVVDVCISLFKENKFEFRMEAPAKDEKRLQEALDAYNKAIELKPDDAEAWLSKAIALDELGRHLEAIEAFLKAIELNPDYAEVW
jgi:putative nucleotidyltransferase with HDIG domain